MPEAAPSPEARRPDRFTGNRAVAARLEEKLAGGRLPHAMIFSGPEGVGKHTFALRLAQRLNCRASAPPCGACAACRRIAAGVHPDVTVLTLEGEASQIKIDQVRELRATLALEPMEGAGKVYIVDPAEAMSPGAANAMLKSLEEPPPRTYFMLITANAHELLVTIRSRCQIHRFAPLPLEEIRAAGVDDELVVRWSAGSLGRALAGDPAELRATRDRVLDFIEGAMTASRPELAGLLPAGGELARAKAEQSILLRMAAIIVSDVLSLALGREERVVNLDVRDRLERLSERSSLERLVQVGECLRFIEANQKFHLNRQTAMDVLLLTLHPGAAEILHDKAWEAR